MRHGVVRAHAPSRSGTTVIELVVALVVTGAVAAAGAAAFRQAVDRRTQLLASSAETERAAALRALVREWLSAGDVIWPPATDGLTFTTTSSTPVGAPGAATRLYVDLDPATPEEGLALEVRSPTSIPVVRRELDRTITAMTIEYLDPTTRAWLTTDNAPAQRPLAVRITFPSALPPSAIGDERSDALRRLPMTIVLPASAPAIAGGTAVP